MYDSLFNLTRESPKLLKRLYNILLVGSISSFLFSVAYFKYELIPPTDYPGIYNFLVRGEFIVPFGMFFIIWYFTEAIGGLIFTLITQRFKGNIFSFLIELIEKPTDSKKIQKFNRRSIAIQQELSGDFVLFFRTQLALILYTFNVEHFGVLLFIGFFTLTVFVQLWILIKYKFIEGLPLLLAKL